MPGITLTKPILFKQKRTSLNITMKPRYTPSEILKETGVMSFQTKSGKSEFVSRAQNFTRAYSLLYQGSSSKLG